MTVNNKNNDINLADILDAGVNMGLRKKNCMILL